MTTFDDFNLNKPLLNALKDMGFTKPTPIQERGIPAVMSGRNIVGIAQTGTGKTFAYLLPLLRLWNYAKNRHPQILIVVPTRELVAQIVAEIEKLTVSMNVVTVGVYGGASINTQKNIIVNGLDVLVATPGRLLDLALHGALNLKYIKKLVIDEIDEMLSLGFRPQLIRVLDLLPEKRQTMMFSATMTEDISALIDDFFDTPLIIEAAPTGTPLENIIQKGYHVPNFYSKANLLELLLQDKATFNKVMVFVDSKKLADQLFDHISPKFGDEFGIIHSNKLQNTRFATVQSFKEGKIRILIATDIIARGVDISEVSHVINFDAPDNPETYIHRIGRTGRADQKGNAISFFTAKEMEFKEKIEALMNQKIEIFDLPDQLVISDVLTPDEMPKINMKEIQLKLPKIIPANSAFQERSAKNKKADVKLTQKQRYKLKLEKYGDKIKKKR